MNAEQLTVIFEEARSREESLPVSRRVVLYRGLANLCGDLRIAADLNARADELEAACLKCRQFEFRFQTPPAAKPNRR